MEGDKLKLLVVDDEPDNLDLLYRTFRRHFIVFKASSGPEALHILEEHGEMAIIISDQRMPLMKGTEFLSRTVEMFPDTIRIVLTGYTDVEDLVGAINTGKVFKYVTKPWNPDVLQVMVLQAAETYRVIKHRTNELRRALRRESIFNAVTTAIRESLDYESMLNTIVKTLGETFNADFCILYPVQEASASGATLPALASDAFYYSTVDDSADICQEFIHIDDSGALISSLENRQIQLDQCNYRDKTYVQLVIPLRYQHDDLAVLALYREVTAQPWKPEDIELIGEVSEQAALAISQAKLYQQVQGQTEQMRAELAVARQIQSNLLRQSWPNLNAVKIQAHCYPAREVGGDFFEVYVHPQGDIWVAVGDVSGKGVPAALFMASAISVLRRELAQEISPDPNSVMQRLNQSLLNELVNSNCFITAVIARYTPSNGELRYANAGHIYPIVWSGDQVASTSVTGSTESMIEPTYLKERGVPLGILPSWKAPAGHLILETGDVLLLVSDGITEAMVSISSLQTSHLPESSPAMLRQAGLWQLLIQEWGAFDLKKILDQIQSYNSVQEDDQTILSLEVL
jgi:serine phosphatase RsbU (regulator of sigma subunit)/CheY-like chemotaxis protein